MAIFVFNKGSPLGIENYSAEKRMDPIYLSSDGDMAIF